MRMIILVSLLFTLYERVHSDEPKYIAMGNLQTVVHGETLFSTDIDENRPNTSFLWCQIRQNGVPVTTNWGRFIREKDKKVFMADISENEKRAYLYFGKSTAEAAGKYRCELKAEDGSLVFGNMFAYSHPVIKNNASWELSKSEKEEGLVEGPIVYSSYQNPAYLECPVLGYPEPLVVWYKNNFPLEMDERITYNPQSKMLRIDDVTEDDSGIYRCVATNQFPVRIDGEEQEFSVKFNQELRIGDSYGWMLPLAVIIIILLLLFLIIYTCQRCTKYKADNYNVAERERALHNDQVPLKNSV